MVKAETPHAALIYLWVSEGTKALTMSSHALGRYASYSAEPGSQVAPDKLHHLYCTLAFKLTGFTFLLTRKLFKQATHILSRETRVPNPPIIT